MKVCLDSFRVLRWGGLRKLLLRFAPSLVLLMLCCHLAIPEEFIPDFVYVQIPAENKPASVNGMYVPSDRYVDGCRIMACVENGEQHVNLTPDFLSAKDPAISFDGEHILFAGKKDAASTWSIWRMDRDGSNKINLTPDLKHSVSPLYVGSLFHLNDEVPTDRIVFVSGDHGWINEFGHGLAYSLYVCDLDGSHARRISYNLSADFDPEVLPNGRVVYSSWRRFGYREAPQGRFNLLAINNEGTDLMPFYGIHQPPRFKEMVRWSWKDKVYFIESDSMTWLGGGDLACVSLRRPMHLHEILDARSEGLFHTPAPMPGDQLFVSYREKREEAVYGIYLWGETLQPVVEKEDWHCVDAHFLGEHPRVKGRSTVVNDAMTAGAYYCIDVYASTIPEVGNLKPGSVKKVRVIEGLPRLKDLPRYKVPEALCVSGPGSNQFSATLFSPSRILGVVPVEEDGSFFIQLPAELPVSFQLLDKEGMALYTQRAWTWVMPRESRGCVGCHENFELAPPNRMMKAVEKPAVRLTLPPQKRRTVDFKHNIQPIIEARCSGTDCHSPGNELPNLDVNKLVEHKDGSALFSQAYENLLGEIPNRDDEYYVQPGSARKSPLIWHLLGEGFDEEISYSSEVTLMPPETGLSEVEKLLFIEWVDLGAVWDSRTLSEHVAETQPQDIDKGDLW